MYLISSHVNLMQYNGAVLRLQIQQIFVVTKLYAKRVNLCINYLIYIFIYIFIYYSVCDICYTCVSFHDTEKI